MDPWEAQPSNWTDQSGLALLAYLSDCVSIEICEDVASLCEVPWQLHRREKDLPRSPAGVDDNVVQKNDKHQPDMSKNNETVGKALRAFTLGC